MTVIACRSGIMAADTATWDGDIKIGRVKKIIRLRDGSLVAACGMASLIQAYYAWMQGKGDRPPDAEKQEDFSGIHLLVGGVVRVVDRIYREFDHDAEFYAEGSHTEFLYGAMAAGASAEEAVRLALKYGGFAGGEVQVEHLDRSTDERLDKLICTNPTCQWAGKGQHTHPTGRIDSSPVFDGIDAG